MAAAMSRMHPRLVVWIPSFILSLVSALQLRTMAGMGRGSVIRHVGRQVHASGALDGESLDLLGLAGHHIGAYAAVVAV